MTRARNGQFARSDSFMQPYITQKGRLATCDCDKCGATNYWHEWTSEGQADDLKTSRCDQCFGPMDPESFWESPSRNYYAARYSAAGYMDCTDWSYGKNKRELLAEINSMYGDDS